MAQDDIDMWWNITGCLHWAVSQILIRYLIETLPYKLSDLNQTPLPSQQKSKHSTREGCSKHKPHGNGNNYHVALWSVCFFRAFLGGKEALGSDPWGTWLDPVSIWANIEQRELILIRALWFLIDPSQKLKQWNKWRRCMVSAKSRIR